MAVDNVFLTHNTCPGPLNLTASYVANDTVVITWQPGGSESSWIVSDGVESYDVFDTTYLFEGLSTSTLSAMVATPAFPQPWLSALLAVNSVLCL